MPRGGSKKGEHRGQLRRSLKSPTAPKVNKGGRPKVRFDPKRGVMRKKGSKNKMSIEREAAMAAMISGNGFAHELPKEAMLSGMRYYLEQWRDYCNLITANMSLAAQAHTPKAQKAFEDQIAVDEVNRDRYWLMALDAARNAAPYCHARLQAIALAGDTPDGPYEAVKSILAEIEGMARGQPMVIEHMRDETV